MGKKSKRNRSNKASDQRSIRQTASSNERKPTEKETLENLMFEDQFEDVYEEEEEMIKEEEEEEEEGKGETIKENQACLKSWTPFNSTKDEKLEITPEAYKLYYGMNCEWPCLTFDFVKDRFGSNRTRFPHSLFAVIGTQADKKSPNKITLLKLDDLSRMKSENDEEDVDDSENDESDDDDESDDELEEDNDPTIEYYSMKHDGIVNRLRVLPSIEDDDDQNNEQIVACWSSKGVVSLYNISSLLNKFDVGSGRLSSSKDGPFFCYTGHETEGYAMNFSTKEYGTLATGDCAGNIHIWNYLTGYDQNSFTVEPYYKSEHSIEDIQWSPTETTVLSSAECNGYISIYDTRCKGKSMLQCFISNTDVNCLSWNQHVSNLLATGSDDGVFSVWDLRTFTSSQATPDPLARFQPNKSPITSLEWHPTDESMIVISDEDYTYIYDLSVEVDDSSEISNVPPQMLFCHCGNQYTKEVHWHPQISSMVMTTSQNGLSVFIPSNL